MDKRKTYEGPRFPNKLREFRGERWTQREIAEIIGINRANYALIETGIRLPGLAIVKVLCEHFKTSEDDLFPNLKEIRRITGCADGKIGLEKSS